MSFGARRVYDVELKEVLKLIKEERFYHTTAWRKTRKIVLRRDNFECQECKRQGKYSKATTVHHKKHLKDRPDLALDLNNLESLCNPCHNKEHPERFENFYQEKKKPFTPERW